MKEISPRNRAAVLLAKPDAPRVFTRASLGQWLAERDSGIGTRVQGRVLQLWADLGLIERVAHGVYLNLRARPRPVLDEAAVWLRKGAVISLHRVLGQAGVLNNPTPNVTCVLPLSESRNSGVVKSAGGTFVFSGMRGDLVPQDSTAWDGDAIQAYAEAPTATREKALMDWLYLAAVRGTTSPPPRHDIDLDELDGARLRRLAGRMGLEAELDAFIDGRLARTHGQRKTARRHP